MLSGASTPKQCALSTHQVSKRLQVLLDDTEYRKLEAVLGVVDEVYPVERADVEAAKTLLDGIPSLSARDALHVAVMKRREVSRILSFDAGFDAVPGLERLA